MEINIQISNRVIIGGIIGLFMILLLFINIINDIYVKVRKRIKEGPKDEDDKASLDILIFIYLNIFLIFIHMISLLFRYVYILDDSYCFTISKICIVLFQLTRSTQYIVFIRRIQVIYSGTVFDLREKYIYILYSFVAIYALPYICYLDWTIFFRSTYTNTYGCSMKFHPALFFPQSFFDIFISLSALYLFIFPLRALIQHQADQRDDELRNQIYNILIKYCLLYGTTIASSIILIIISYIFPYGFYYAIIDGLCNGMMLILLNPEHNMCYKFICCPFRLLCIECCNKHAQRQQKKLEAIASATNSNSPKHKTPGKSLSPSRLKITEIAVFFEVGELEIEVIEPLDLVTSVPQQTPIDVILTRVNAYRQTNEAGADLTAIAEAPEPRTASNNELDNHIPRSLSNMYKQAANSNPSFYDASEQQTVDQLSAPMKISSRPKPYKVRSNSSAVDASETPEAQKYISIAIDKALSMKSLKNLKAVDEARETELENHMDLSEIRKMAKHTSYDSKNSAHESVCSGDSTFSGNSIHHLNTSKGNSIQSNRLDVRHNTTSSLSRSINTIRLISLEADQL